MGKFRFDDELQFADSVTLNNDTETSAVLLIGEKSGLAAYLKASAATVSQEFILYVWNSEDGSTDWDVVAAGAMLGRAGGGPVSLVIPFTAYRPYVKISVIAPAAGTIVYDGWIGEATVSAVPYQRFGNGDIY